MNYRISSKTITMRFCTGQERRHYIFKDTKYGIYTYEQNKFVSNSTRFIVADWHGLPNKVDAAVFIDALDAGYIFTGNQYWRVNMTSKRVDQGYPKLILDFLRGHEQGNKIFITLLNPDLTYCKLSPIFKYG